MAETRRSYKPPPLETDLPKIQKPVDMGGAYNGILKVNMDKDDLIFGIASGHHIVYPHRDFGFLAGFDEPYLHMRDAQKYRLTDLQYKRQAKYATKSRSRLSSMGRDSTGSPIKRVDRLQPDEEDALEAQTAETYESVFVEYMNKFNFEQMDMVNPEERVEYTAYLNNLEKTMTNYLGANIDINGRTTDKALPRVAQT